jgi:hypothetical protein
MAMSLVAQRLYDTISQRQFNSDNLRVFHTLSVVAFVISVAAFIRSG